MNTRQRRGGREREREIKLVDSNEGRNNEGVRGREIGRGEEKYNGIE